MRTIYLVLGDICVSPSRKIEAFIHERATQIPSDDTFRDTDPAHVGGMDELMKNIYYYGNRLKHSNERNTACRCNVIVMNKVFPRTLPERPHHHVSAWLYDQQIVNGSHHETRHHHQPLLRDDRALLLRHTGRATKCSLYDYYYSAFAFGLAT